MSINKVLKLAKAAIDKKDYEAALKHCQVSTYNLYIDLILISS